MHINEFLVYVLISATFDNFGEEMFIFTVSTVQKNPMFSNTK